MIGWTAAWAVLLAALMPTVAHAWALGSGSGTAWMEVCTTQGSKWVASDTALDGGSAPGAAHAAESCPYCSLHVPVLGFPPAEPANLPAVSRALVPPAAFLAAPRTLHAWLSTQPRAPPPVS